MRTMLLAGLMIASLAVTGCASMHKYCPFSSCCPKPDSQSQAVPIDAPQE